MPQTHQDWSDSDEEELSTTETSVLLGVPDGPVEHADDIADAAVSRIGGRPAFLSALPPLACSQCKVCQKPTELLVQMWCPFEDSPMDRALYVWGCANAACQAKAGSVRAWRGLRYNEEYAIKLKAKLAKRRTKEEAKAREREECERKIKAGNPFSSSSSTFAPNPFGLGAQIFGDSNPTNGNETDAESKLDDEDQEEVAGGNFDAKSDSAGSEDSLVVALAAASIEDSPWTSAPAFPAMYLSTVSEYVPPEPKAKLPKGVEVDDGLDDNNNKKGGKRMDEFDHKYENSLEIDPVLAHFMERVAYEGEQCVRYDLGGTPLPYARDNVYQTLFAASPNVSLPVTRANYVVLPQKREFTTAGIPNCSMCGGPRTFECQLMPNLINLLSPYLEDATPDPDKFTSDEERTRRLQATLTDKTRRALSWGTCMIFSCKKDCAGPDDTLKDIWQEEVVLIQAEV
ncbi:hypothetical protein FISHEDRAFT_63544 [Fistulina hepatica ATCC 64428]|uniref:Programmed cell death protein 2 C-terminal domain-containing protein n=1 Tax=Fistulina hepatica ATCC 64428 TaxID=1128425 RepID=A0A0D7ANG4_9AGAR|nr:hypothetical protein FISHEDRAFT_63544 [Fistulina hepatica ATCC 64428]